MDSKTKHAIGNKLQFIVGALDGNDEAIEIAMEIAEMVRNSDTTMASGITSEVVEENGVSVLKYDIKED